MLAGINWALKKTKIKKDNTKPTDWQYVSSLLHFFLKLQTDKTLTINCVLFNFKCLSKILKIQTHDSCHIAALHPLPLIPLSSLFFY